MTGVAYTQPMVNLHAEYEQALLSLTECYMWSRR